MWPHFFAILWAQSRITRNHFARTTFGTVLSGTLSALWYGVFVFLAVVSAIAISKAPLDLLQMWFPAGLLGLFLYMQVVPLVTLSSGWSLQLNKLQIYPVSDQSLFAIEVLLRLTSAPEMLLLLFGAMFGLMARADVFPLAPLCLLLFIPFNLFLQLAIRDLLLHMFARNRFRELAMILVVVIALLPQILVRSNSIKVMTPYLLQIAGFALAPWHQVSSLSLGRFTFIDLLILAWIALVSALAFWQFRQSKIQDEGFAAVETDRKEKSGKQFAIFDQVAGLFQDPMAAVIQKEFRSLLRMPRFRVLFGMACIVSILIFFPIVIRENHRMMDQNFVPLLSLYGLLLLSDALLLNIFGFDRAAAQIYFLAPLPIATVIKAKNCVAVVFVALQTVAIPIVAALFRLHVNLLGVLSGFLSSAVATLFLLSVGNLMSTTLPRPIDPGSTFRRQAGAKVQMWLLGCSVGMAALVGFAYLARWATDRDWVLLAVLALELAIGIVVYSIALESSVNRALSNQESIVAALSKNAAPVSAG